MIPKKNRPPARLVLSAALLCAFVALLLVTYGAGPRALMERAATFYAFAVNHAWLLVFLYLLRLPLLLPASLVIVLTGMICGPLVGELVAIAGLTLGGGIEFLLVRKFTATLSTRLSDVPWLGEWRERIRRNPFHAILFMRVCFIPFDPINVVSALAGAPLRPFLLATALGVAPTCLPMIFFGASVDFSAWMASGRIWPGGSAIHWPYILASVALAGLTALHARHRRRHAPPDTVEGSPARS